MARSLGRGDLLAGVAATWPPTMGRQMIAWNAEYRPLVEEALAVLAPDALAVRALLTSALVITPPDSDSMQRRDELSREAVDLARRSGDDGALYRALESRLWALVAPERQEERLRVAGEMVDLADRAAAPVLEFHAREHRVRSLLALGRMADADREIEACAQCAEALRLPAYHLSVARFRTSRALGSGRFDEAEALTEECRRLTERIDDPDVGMMRMLWTVAILFARGGLEQLAPGMEDSWRRRSG